jgi:hypothetical protein
MGVSVFPVRLIVHQADVELAQSVLDSYVAEDESQEDFESGNTEPDDPQSI